MRITVIIRISIHALREEGDLLFLRSASVDANFYPRPPRGGRPVNRAHRFAVAIFLSTPSARRATGCHQFSPPAIPYFYPRPPRGGRPASVPPRSGQGRISIHALREEGDTKTEKESAETENISIHALREEGDKRLRRWTEYNNISIHALREEGDSKNREKTLCFCLIIHLPAQIAKRCL